MYTVNLWFLISELLTPPETVTLQQAPSVEVKDNIDYPGFDNVAFNDQALKVPVQE